MWDILLVIACVIVIVMLWWILYDSNRFVISQYEIADKRIKKGCRMVMLADLHNKCYGKNNERLLRAIRECKPDFIMVAGDIPTAKPGKSLDVAVSFMEELAKEYPVYYGNGNHEHRMKLYPNTYGDMAERYDEALKKCGIRPLVNEHIALAEYGIMIYGAEIDKLYYKRFRIWPMGEEYLESILGKPSEEQYNILIAHNPDYFKQYATWGADLVLSGHVHGGIIRIPFLKKGVASPSIRLFPQYTGGVYREDKSAMVLSRGLGMHTIPIRLFNPGEVAVIDLVSNS